MGGPLAADWAAHFVGMRTFVRLLAKDLCLAGEECRHDASHGCPGSLSWQRGPWGGCTKSLSHVAGIFAGTSE